MPYLTGNAPPADTKCYSVKIPNDAQTVAAFVGAVYTLTKERNWEKYGTQTPNSMASLYLDIYNGMVLEPGNCLLTGQIVALATSALPDNVLLCDGGSYLRVDYPGLYAVLNSAYITDADNFVVPDLRARFVYGAHGVGGVGTRGGQTTITLGLGAMPAHSHVYNAPLALTTLIGAGLPTPSNIGTVPASTSVAGSGNPVNILPPFERLLYAIVAL